MRQCGILLNVRSSFVVANSALAGDLKSPCERRWADDIVALFVVHVALLHHYYYYLSPLFTGSFFF